MHLAFTPRVVISRSKARQFGFASIAAVLAIQIATEVACGGPIAAKSMALGLAMLLIPLSPAVLALLTSNPLCSVAAAIPVAAWIGFAYYQDCVRPYQGGGASFTHVAVWFYGFLCAAASAAVAIPLLRLLGIRVSAA